MTGPDFYLRAKKRIPGGTQLLSKRPEMFLPDEWPAYFAEARGAEVWDLDGRRFLDMSFSSVGACILGYADPDVNAAVRSAVDLGSMCTLNCPEDVTLADLLCEIHPWADLVRYARCGGEAMAVAVRVARARSRRGTVVFCGYHGWHDWYLAANAGSSDALGGHLLPGLEPAGVPAQLAGTAIPFVYNDLSGFHAAVERAGDDLGAVVMEPTRGTDPAPGFLETIREVTRSRGIPLVFDEVTAGWRLNTGGIHLRLGVAPDIAVFAKGISNGYPMAAIIGTGDVMQAAQDTFVSSTYWTERIGPSAALATIRKHRALDAGSLLADAGARVQQGWKCAARTAGLDITVSGLAPLARFTLNYSNAQAMRTLFTQEMLDRGYLASNLFYAMVAHTAGLVDGYICAVREVFALLKEAVDEGSVERRLRGPVAHSGFYRLAQ
jgi:glutamate-1-semialdehyde aminotransferase